MNKTCISCGMPMTEPEHFSMNDTSRDYCCHCSHEDGSMRTDEETFASMTQFMMKTQGIKEAAAQTAVKEMLAKLPAWKDISLN